MIARYSAAVSFGTVVTFGLLFIMQLLIATGAGAVTESRAFILKDFILVERDEVIETVREIPEKPPEPEVQPRMTESEHYDESDGTIAVSIPSPENVIVTRTDPGFGVSDGEYLPLVKVAPVYPSRALSRGLEGYVIVEFTVTITGAVRDVRVVESTSSLFDRAATEAALKFKYKPRVIDGLAVEVPGVQNKISFEIAN